MEELPDSQQGLLPQSWIQIFIKLALSSDGFLLVGYTNTSLVFFLLHHFDMQEPWA